MPIAFRASSTAVGNNVTSVTIPKPAGAVAEDVLVAYVYVNTNASLTAPSGWALTQTVAGTQRTGVFVKVAGASEPANYTFGTTASAQDWAGAIVAYSGVDMSTPVHVSGISSETNTANVVAPAVTVSVNGSVLIAAHGASSGTTRTLPTPDGLTSRASILWSSTVQTALRLSEAIPNGTGTIGPFTSNTFDPSTGHGATVALAPRNYPPNAPILDVPSSVDRNVTNRFSLTASDPDAGDTTSKTDWRYRTIGAPTWTTVTKTSPTTFYDFAAGTFLGTDYEIQARTYDAAGEVGPYSSSSFFTANDAPDQPTWTDPLNGQTIGTASYTGTISAPDVDESEWRLVADNAGVIDEATVLHGPVLKTTGDVRSHTFTDLANGVTVWWQARTKFGGLWSQWAAVRTPVAYTPPPAPTVTPAASNEDGAVSVTVSTPTPGAGEPTVEYVDLYVRDTTGTDTYRPTSGIRWAMFRVPNGVTVDWKAASGINYEYQAVAHGDNGTTAASAWTAIDPDAVATIYYGGDGY